VITRFNWSVIVPVTLVRGVPVAVVYVVRVAVVGHRDVSALRSVLVVMAAVHLVALFRAFVDMVVVDAVEMAVVHIVRVVAVRDRHMAAAGPVGVLVPGVGAVVNGGGHG
jgi:hypothetical protein